MLPPESEPVPLQARSLAVPLLEACPVRRLPLLCMCLSFESSILFEHSVVLRQRFVLVPVAASILVQLTDLRHVFPCSCEITSDCDDNPIEGAALNHIMQSFGRFGQREGFSHDRSDQ